MIKNLIKLTLDVLLNQGIEKSDLTNIATKLDKSEGTYLLGVGATIVIEKKQRLTPKEKLRKKLIILFLASFLIMIVLSWIGSIIPQASLGRLFVLISEFPAFISALASTRIFIKERRDHTEEKAEEIVDSSKPPIIEPS